MVHHRCVAVDGVSVFYREAGDVRSPAVLLLHGFPSSSHMFRGLIPRLADRFRVVAPDLPGFGFSDAPDRASFRYSFEKMAMLMGGFTSAIGLARHALYVFDYGAPVGFRMAVAAPERVVAIVTQNGNAYAEGLSPGWAPIQRYWSEPSRANREALRGLLSLESTKQLYLQGVTDPSLV